MQYGKTTTQPAGQGPRPNGQPGGSEAVASSFPTGQGETQTAPGSFLYVEEMGQYVCSSTSLTAPRSGQRRSHRRPVWILP